MKISPCYWHCHGRQCPWGLPNKLVILALWMCNKYSEYTETKILIRTLYIIITYNNIRIQILMATRISVS